MDSLEIIQKYYDQNSKSYYFLTEHGKLVAEKALELAEKVNHLNPDLEFIKEAAMIHDIGIFLTNDPRLGCFGDKPYIAHGYLGRELLENEGYPRHALVCERHVGVGITKEEIEKQNLLLPKRDMLPETIEEKIICFADKFYSKKPEKLFEESSIEKIKESVAKYGGDNIKRLDELLKLFNM